MSSDIIISLCNINKIYRTYRHPFLRLMGRIGSKHKEFHALNGISFDVRRGETIGIIGKNGSGKSTLLQIICGIRKPTSGIITVHGRISALLELGSGFQPEFTGRENVFLQGAIMGYTREAMASRFDEIAEFAGIGEFIDQPVKTYSSGMFVRLAFAVAINVEPDILVIDEALAVGDMEFQKKSFDQLARMTKSSGMTVILVSHELRQIQRFCSRAIFLDQGKCVLDGESNHTCQKYYEMSYVGSNSDFIQARIKSADQIELLSVHFFDSNGHEIHEISSGDAIIAKLRFHLKHPLKNPEFIVGTQASDLTCLSASSTTEFGMQKNFDAGVHEIEYRLDQFPLIPGKYYIRFNVIDENFRFIFAGEALKEFYVRPDENGATKPVRLLNLKTRWRFN